MKKTFVCALTVLALTLTAAAEPKTKKQDLKLFWSSEIAGTQLKAGDYQVSVDGSQATLYRGGKRIATFAVHSEAVTEKYEKNSVVYEGNERAVKEIRLAGSAAKLVVDGPATSAAGAGGKN